MILISDNEFKLLAGFIKTNFGINLYHKKALLEGRLSLMLSAKGYTNFTDYINHIIQDETNQEVTELINKITTNYTFFMREGKHFQYLMSGVLPQLEKWVPDKDLRIWSAGCSTGEEPFTLAMLFYEYFGLRKKEWNTQILATDISVKCLEHAKKGVYSETVLNELPKNWLRKYFHSEQDGTFRIKEHLKDEVIFRVFNLMDDTFPFRKKFHIIFCRNVMIYFDSETRKRLINRLYNALEPGGYLFIGHSETISRQDTEFRYVMPSVYKKETEHDA